MRILNGQSRRAALAALAIGLALVGIARAQEDGGGANVFSSGIIEGMVARCVNGVETPARAIAVGVEGGSPQLARTDDTGGFLLALPPGQYTITATAADGFASRPYVPVEVGETLDIGILDIGGGVAGCGLADEVTAPMLPTFTPTAMPTLEPPTPTPTAVPIPTPTPEPMPDENAAPPE